ncbi:MAG TPA: hypothetical protein VMS40_04435 [Vicinamibacterales bacterium]|nr:hypothetical protein [Vicinamibacterales bacterium]
MGAHYYLDPFEVDMPANQSGRIKYASKLKCIVIEDRATQISRISDIATLIIDGHSATGSETISRVAVGPGNQSIHFTELARRLVTARLPLTHVLIRLLACEGSVYACRLAEALGRYGYNAIAVGGYTVTNWQIPGQRTRFPSRYYDDDDQLNQAKPILWYGSLGQRLPAKPPVS